MFNPSPIEIKLNAEIVRVLEKMEKLDPRSEEYVDYSENLSKLIKLRNDDSENSANQQKFQDESFLKQFSPDSVLVVAANLFGIIWLTRYERENVISSKSLGFVMKPRI